MFVTLIAGTIACFGLLFTEALVRPPVWVEAAIWLPIAVGLCLVLLRPFKGLMVAAQMLNHASEHRRDE